MARKSVAVEVKASSIKVGGSLYPVGQISGVKVVKVKKSTWEFLSGGRRYAVLMKMQGETYFLLVVTRDEEKIQQLFSQIQDAIDSNAQQNFNYIGSINFNDVDTTNMSGNFGVGFNKGEVSIG